VTPEEAVRRKDVEMTRAEVERRRDLYRQMAPRGAILVDTGRGPDVVSDEIGRLVLAAALRPNR
jgi:hypothetical protein